MAKERLSKLQKWILLQCYKEGRYDGRYDKEPHPKYYAVGIDYYVKSKDLRWRRSSGYYKKINGSKYTVSREGKTRIRNKLFMSLYISIKNLRKKGYIAKLPADYHTWRLWQYEGIWLTKEGIKLAKSLINNGLINSLNS